MNAAKLVCMCGVVHALPRERALDGLSVAQWRCTDCGRRFVLTHTATDGFVPVYLDSDLRSIEPRETGSGVSKRAAQGNPVPPPALDFACRCGTRITAHAWMYGGTVVCPGCRTALLVVLKYHLKRKEYVVAPEYPAKV